MKWMALNSMATSCSSVISTHAMLSSITAPLTTPSSSLAVTSTYIGRDLIGQLGGLVYSWRTGKKSAQQSLKYVTVGAILQQGSFFLENSAIFLPASLSLPFLGLCSTLKNISFISMGAVNATNLQRISTKTDMDIGDLYAKVASINTLASTAGMALGIILLHLIPSYSIRTVTILPILGAISIFTLRKSTQLGLQMVYSDKKGEN